MDCSIKTIVAFCAALALGGCDSEKAKDTTVKAAATKSADGGKAGDKKPAADKADEGGTLPAETVTLALDEGDSKIPATVDVPKGCTTFNDDPTKIRINFGEKRERGKLFGIQIAKGNEFNTNLDEIEKGMLENKYGSTNKILEKTETLLRYTMQREGSEPTHKFQLIVDVGGDKWVCKQGNRGGYDEAAIQKQIDACKTLKAKA